MWLLAGAALWIGGYVWFTVAYIWPALRATPWRVIVVLAVVVNVVPVGALAWAVALTVIGVPIGAVILGLLDGYHERARRRPQAFYSDRR